MRNLIPIISVFLLFFGCKSPDFIPLDVEPSVDIRLNQIGYYPEAQKIAVIKSGLPMEPFRIVSLEDQKARYSGNTSTIRYWPLAGDSVVLADFSAFCEPGNYVLYTENDGASYPFSIGEQIYAKAFRASAKSYYYQRASMAIEEKYGGKWHRPAGHPDDAVSFHPALGKSGTISSSKGWYDAGDYGKYVVNGAFSLGQILFLGDEYPGMLSDGSLNIPESGNGIPDVLDELKYEMDWLLTMQDEDGGVFFKLTTLTFSGMKLPHLIKKPRFIIGKNTAASLNFAAVAAKMSRIMADFDHDYAQTCLDAARKAWNWAIANPNSSFQNPPDVKTGEYPDDDFSQELYWAAAELYVTTGKDVFLSYLKNPPPFVFKANESWANYMHFLGAFILVEKQKGNHEELKNILVAQADSIIQVIQYNDYLQPISDFPWGSNSDIMNAAMIMMHVHRWTNKDKYKIGVLHCIDYIFGRNAQGYSFVTGFGYKSPMNLHHRPSAGDEIDEPVPGFLIGGPNYGKHDGHNVQYPDNAPPMKCWVDDQKSFASNEVCLNWNAPLTYVLGVLVLSPD